MKGSASFVTILRGMPIQARNRPMLEAGAFTVFMRRIRAGDEQAATELVRQYEPLIRREVRLHLEDRGLCRLFDSMDVCQSVLASFFLRTAAGQYDLQSPPQLVKLLVTMARHKLASAARRQRRHKRDHRKAVGGHGVLDQVAGTGPSPSEHVAGKELLERVRGERNDDERAVAELRAEGLGWPEIAGRLGGKPQARRMVLAGSALDRAGRGSWGWRRNLMNEATASTPSSDVTSLPQDNPAEQLQRLWQHGQRPDVDEFLTRAGTLAAAQIAAVLRVDQRQRWQAGQRVRAEEYLQRYAILEADPESALDLIFNEFLLREKRGEAPRVEEYLDRFPQFAAVLRQQIELHLALAGGTLDGTNSVSPGTATVHVPSENQENTTSAPGGGVAHGSDAALCENPLVREFRPLPNPAAPGAGRHGVGVRGTRHGTETARGVESDPLHRRPRGTGGPALLPRSPDGGRLYAPKPLPRV